MSYEKATVRGTLHTPGGTPHEGRVVVTASVPVVRDGSGGPVIAGRTIAELTEGAFTLQLPCTDDPALAPTGFGYRLRFELAAHAMADVTFTLPRGTGTVDLSTLVPVTAPVPVPEAAAPARDLAALAGRVQSLEDAPAPTTDLDGGTL